MKKRFVLGFIFLSIFAFNSFARDKATLTKKDGALFWEMTGVDNDGKESKVYILGTFHAGDERLYPLPQFVLDAYDNADRVCGEISSVGWELFQVALQNKMMEDMIYDEELQLSNFLTEEEYDIVFSNIGFQLTALNYYKPWVLNQVLSSMILSESDMEFVEAYDNYFINLSNERGIPMEGLDLVSRQIDCLAYGDFDYQMAALKLSIESLDDPEESIEYFEKLYEAYLTGDEKIMTEAYFDQLDMELEMNPDAEGYYEALLKDRNRDWAVTIDEYLQKGGTTFIFAGTGHFIGNDSVFSFMRNNGTLK